jgi:hypothetical protein
MKVGKDCAQIYASVFTERQPMDCFDFEQRVDKFLIERTGTKNIYANYEHGLDETIKNFSAILNKIETFYGDLGKTSFEMKKFKSEDAGNFVVVQWKNPHYKLLSRPINRIVVGHCVI